MPDDWRDEAACRGHDPDIFFPERGASLEAARAICSACSVFDPRWAQGLYEKHGVWGGTSERERRRIRRARGIVLHDPEDIEDHDDPMKDTA